MSHSAFRIVSIRLDEGIGRHSAEIEQEKNVAIYDILEQNHFRPEGSPGGPYHLVLTTAENRLMFDLRLNDDSEHGRILLSLTPFRRVLKEYHQVCQTYYAAIREAPPARIEAIDMGRRGCTTTARISCATALRARSRWISTPRGASSR